MNGHWDGPAQGSWTAIAKAPDFKAIALYAKGDGWHGGGLMLSNTSYWLNDGYGHKLMTATTRLTRNARHQPEPSYGGECPGVYYHRLQRDGWTLMESDGSPAFALKFEKRLGDGWTLRKRAHAQIGSPPGKGCYWDEHELEHSASGLRLTREGWEWAEWDGDRDRVVWGCRGELRAARLGRRGLADERLLCDFNPMRFQPIAAPH